MPLLISIVLALIPLAGIAWVLTRDSIATVDGLFTALILLTISGVLLLNALLELRDRRKRKRQAAKPQLVAVKAATIPGSALQSQRGVVETVHFYEAPVGLPDTSVVTLRNGAGRRLITFEGDLRHTLPFGKEIEITYRAAAGRNDLLGVDEVSWFAGRKRAA